jgi:hypothetical protein
MAKETWYSAQEAVDAGLADEIDEPSKQDQNAPDEMAVAASWDLSVFRYAGREEAPAPAPVAVAESSLTISIEGAVDEDLVARLRAAVQAPAEAEPVIEPEPVVEPKAPAVPEPVAAVEPAEPEPVDEWAGAFAHLLEPDPDPWAAAFAHLTNPEASSSAATEA